MRRKSWSEIQDDIASCKECTSASKSIVVRRFDERTRMPDPLSYVEKLKLLMIAWSPPGGAKARSGFHFFYNAESKDLMRPKLFTAFKRAGYKGLREATASDAIENSLRYGLFLIPTVFRRCSRGESDSGPPRDLADHSFRAHAMQVFEYCNPEVVFLMGRLPLGAAIRAFPEDLSILKSCLNVPNEVMNAREKSRKAELYIQSGNARARLIATYWPRGRGIDRIAEDARDFAEPADHKGD
jgi:hypothetical protein